MTHHLRHFLRLKNWLMTPSITLTITTELSGLLRLNVILYPFFLITFNCKMIFILFWQVKYSKKTSGGMPSQYTWNDIDSHWSLNAMIFQFGFWYFIHQFHLTEMSIIENPEARLDHILFNLKQLTTLWSLSCSRNVSYGMILHSNDLQAY